MFPYWSKVVKSPSSWWNFFYCHLNMPKGLSGSHYNNLSFLQLPVSYSVVKLNPRRVNRILHHMLPSWLSSIYFCQQKGHRCGMKWKIPWRPLANTVPGSGCSVRQPLVLLLCPWLCAQMGQLLGKLGYRGNEVLPPVGFSLRWLKEAYGWEPRQLFLVSLGLPWRRHTGLVRWFLSHFCTPCAPHISWHTATAQHFLSGFADGAVCSQCPQQEMFTSRNRKKTQSLWGWAANLHILSMRRKRGPENERKKT